jgi:hypothetical protein
MAKTRTNVASGPWRVTLDGKSIRSQGRVVARCENKATAQLLVALYGLLAKAQEGGAS